MKSNLHKILIFSLMAVFIGAIDCKLQPTLAADTHNKPKDSSNHSREATPEPSIFSPTRNSQDPNLLVPIQQNGKYGYADKTGKVVVSPQFDEVRNFTNGMGMVKLNNKYGFVDRTGKLVIPLTFDDAQEFSEGLASVKVGNKWGYIDKTGKVVISPQYDDARHFSEGLGLVGLDSEPSTQNSSSEVSAKTTRKYGYIDRTGKVVIPINLDNAFTFSEGLVQVRNNEQPGVEGSDKYGYMDKTGRIVIQRQFGCADPFSEGMARVSINNKHGYIDKTGKFVIPPQFDSAASFSNGLAQVRLGDKTGYIDKTGKFVENAAQ